MFESVEAKIGHTEPVSDFRQQPQKPGIANDKVCFQTDFTGSPRNESSQSGVEVCDGWDYLFVLQVLRFGCKRPGLAALRDRCLG